VLFLADGNGDFTKAMDLELDGRGFGLGSRSQRYAAVIENGVVSAWGDGTVLSSMAGSTDISAYVSLP
jgi:peroxiredoxin